MVVDPRDVIVVLGKRTPESKDETESPEVNPAIITGLMSYTVASPKTPVPVIPITFDRLPPVKSTTPENKLSSRIIPF